MKPFIYAGCLSLALAGAALGQPLSEYVNTGFLTYASVEIDATNVLNLGVFDIDLPDADGQFGFSDVLNYTNRNVMYCSTGFLFNDSPSTSGTMGPSTSFVNQNPGQVYGGALNAQTGFTNTSGSAPRLIINATNITSSGILQVGQAGEIQVTGSSLDLSHGTTLVEGFDQAASGIINGGTVLGPGEFIDFWGGGLQSNNFFLSNLSLSPASSPQYSQVTNSDHTTEGFYFYFGTAHAIVYTNIINPSNIYTQAVLYLDTGPNNNGFSVVNESAYFLPPVTTPISTNNFMTAVVQWGVQVTNAFGQVQSNSLYLTDDLGSLPTNLTFVTNNTTLSGLAQLVPTNYTLGPAFRGGLLTNTGNGPYSPSLFTSGFGTNGVGEITNEYAMLHVTLAPVTYEPDSSTAGSTFSNVPGRVEITADKSLNMADAVINAGNYLNLTSTNDYRGSQSAQISFPFADINLGSSNGQMTISNLVVPYLTRFNGQVYAWTGAWTNLTSATAVVTTGTNTTTNTFTVTNGFMVTMVWSTLGVTSPVSVESLALRSTNLVISDDLNVTSSMLINAQNLTITSNASGDLTPNGKLVFAPTNGSELYSANFPSLLNFTNFGSMETVNAAFFQVRQNPLDSSPGDGPWQSIVNHGQIESPGDISGGGGGGMTFWANYFENTGFSTPAVIETVGAYGPVFVQSSTALMTNSYLVASQGDMSVNSGSLTINNDTVSSTGYLDLAATNLLTDLTAPGSTAFINPVNFFSAGDGFSLLAAPATGDLLGSQVTSACRSDAVCQNIWAGRSNTLSGGASTPLPMLSSNVPIGQLILDGGNNISVFHFAGLDSVNPYAMYVDQIILEDGATNFAGGKYTAFNIDPNMTIYYLKASIGANDISPVLAGQAAGGGHLVWLNNYVGHFSATKVIYGDGESFNVNSAYVQAYGLPPEPPVPLTPQNIMLLIGATNINSTPMATISWYAQAYSTNTLYYRTLSNPTWLVRTNFVQGATAGRVSCLDTIGSSHLYKVSVAPSQ